MARIADTDYHEMWIGDKQSIIDTMYSNMNSDLNVGYDPNGKSITEQKATIDAYTRDFALQLGQFVYMTDTEVNRWCYYDLVHRGAITPIGR